MVTGYLINAVSEVHVYQNSASPYRGSLCFVFYSYCTMHLECDA